MKFNTKLIDQPDDSLRQMFSDAIQSKPCDWLGLTWAQSRIMWKMNRRPFFNVYPTIEDAIVRSKICIDLSLIPRSIVHELKAIEIRFSDSSGRQPFMLTITEPRKWSGAEDLGPVEGLYVSRARFSENGSETIMSSARMPFGRAEKEEMFKKKERHDAYDDMEDELRIAIGVLLLAADDQYCEPILLNRDKNRQLTGGNLQLAIERARRNGVFGFDLGASIEVSPHFRRPHFAIRWTGQNASVPRLVPVKGSMINRGLLGKVPTGYEDDPKHDQV